MLLLQANLYLIVFYGFYYFFLRRDTFHQLNRIYLLGSLIGSFLIPAWESAWVQSWFVTEQVREVVTNISLDEIVIQPQQTVFNWQAVLLNIYWLGAVVSAGIFGLRLLKTILLLKSTKKDGNQPPFSFMGYRFVPESVAGREIIKSHECVHSTQLHSIDIIFLEIVLIFNWFNPVVYALRQSLKNIHEFIADAQAVTKTDKADYAMLLFSQSFQVSPSALTHHFFDKLTLKQRIIMLNKNQSHRIAILKYGLIAPLFLAMLIFTASCMNHSAVLSEAETNAKETVSISGKVLGISDKKAIPGAIVKLKNGNRGTTTDMNGNFRLDNVPKGSELEATFIGFNTITYSVPMKSGKQISWTGFLKEDKNAVAKNDKKLTLSKVSDDNEVFTAVEEPPVYPGGMQELYKYVGKNIRFPEEAKENKVNGKVFVSFVIEKDGSIGNIEILKGIGYGCDEEAIRVIALMPKWTPGMQSGKPVKVKYTIPITFAEQVIVIEKAEITNSTDNVLFLLNGKEMQKEDIKNLKPDDIEKINVIKDAKALEAYGEKGKNGVVEITTKK